MPVRVSNNAPKVFAEIVYTNHISITIKHIIFNYYIHGKVGVTKVTTPFNVTPFMKGGTRPTERIYCLIATAFRAYDINFLIIHGC